MQESVCSVPSKKSVWTVFCPIIISSCLGKCLAVTHYMLFTIVALGVRLDLECCLCLVSKRCFPLGAGMHELASNTVFIAIKWSYSFDQWNGYLLSVSPRSGLTTVTNPLPYKSISVYFRRIHIAHPLL